MEVYQHLHLGLADKNFNLWRTAYYNFPTICNQQVNMNKELTCWIWEKAFFWTGWSKSKALGKADYFNYLLQCSQQGILKYMQLQKVIFSYMWLWFILSNGNCVVQ